MLDGGRMRADIFGTAVSPSLRLLDEAEYLESFKLLNVVLE